MRPFKWNTTYTVYLPDVDQEHRDLFRLASELHRALLGDGAGATTGALLAELADHLAVHFVHEESLMAEAEYPSLEWHKRQHQTARKKAASLARRVRKGDAQASADLLEFLGSWLKDHIQVADKMMGAYLRNRRRLWSAMAS